MDRGRGAAVRVAGRLQLLQEAVLAFARRKVHLQPATAGRISTLQLGQHFRGVLDGGERHQAVAAKPIDL